MPSALPSWSTIFEMIGLSFGAADNLKITFGLTRRFFDEAGRIAPTRQSLWLGY
jgi:hypothetical protein